MSRIRLLILSCTVALTVGAAGASPAFATFEKTAVECTTTGVPTECLAESETGKLFEAKGTETGTGKAFGSLGLDFKVESIGLEIQCTSLSVTLGISQTEPLVKGYRLSKVLYKFFECAVTGAHAAECKVVEPIVTKGLSGVSLSENEIELTPESGEIVSEIEIGNKTGTCPATIKGDNPWRGRLTCTLPENKIDLRVHRLSCKLTVGFGWFGFNAATAELGVSFEWTAKTFSDSVPS
jgi:hypothetical protein